MKFGSYMKVPVQENSQFLENFLEKSTIQVKPYQNIAKKD